MKIGGDLYLKGENVLIKKTLKIFATYCTAILISTSSLAGMSENDKSKAWDWVGIYMSN